MTFFASLTVGNATTFVENTAESNGGETESCVSAKQTHRIFLRLHEDSAERNKLN